MLPKRTIKPYRTRRFRKTPLLRARFKRRWSHRRKPLHRKRHRRIIPHSFKHRPYGKYRRRVHRPYFHRHKWHPRRLVIVHDTAAPIVVQGIATRLSLSARTALRRLNLYTPLWLNRLRNAPNTIIRFIEKFHRISGFQHVLWAYYKSSNGRKHVRKLLQLLRDLEERDSRFLNHIHFHRGTIVDEDAAPVRIAILHYRNRLYRVLPSGLTRVKPG